MAEILRYPMSALRWVPKAPAFLKGSFQLSPRTIGLARLLDESVSRDFRETAQYGNGIDSHGVVATILLKQADR